MLTQAAILSLLYIFYECIKYHTVNIHLYEGGEVYTMVQACCVVPINLSRVKDIMKHPLTPFLLTF